MLARPERFFADRFGLNAGTMERLLGSTLAGRVDHADLFLEYRTSEELVLEEGAGTSHVVIVARAMGIPVAGQVKGAVALSENADAIIVDGQLPDGHGLELLQEPVVQQQQPRVVLHTGTQPSQPVGGPFRPSHIFVVEPGFLDGVVGL